MSALHDPTKRTSITALLNPQVHAAPPVNVYVPPPQSPSHSYYVPQNSGFGLHPAANWDSQPDHRGKSDSIHHSQRQYAAYPNHHISQQQQQPSNVYQPTISSSHRQNLPPYPANRRPSPQFAQYPNPSADMQQRPISHYPDPHAVSAAYRTQDLYSSNYSEPTQPSSTHLQAYQTSERASVRLASRGSTEEPSPAYEHHQYHSQQHQHPNAYPQNHPNYPPTHQQVSVPPAESASQGQSSSPQPHTSLSKRQLSENDVPGPKAKRAKPKPKSAASAIQSSHTSGPSKRGYNAKKRQEAATIAAQNASALQRGQLDDEMGLVLFPELQFARCMSNRYRNEEFPRCVSCTRRWAGDTCRFQGIRYFMRDQERKLRGISFSEHNESNESSKMEFPTKWNRTFDREHVTRSKLSIAKALLPTLEAEQEHMKALEIVRRPRETDCRATCDTCMTSLFSTSYMCRMCGREVCSECYQQVVELTHEPEDATPQDLAAIRDRRNKFALNTPFFLTCLRRNEHIDVDFTPVTRFVQTELDMAIKEMTEILKKQDLNDVQMDAASRSTPPLATAWSSLSPTAPFPDPLTNAVMDDYTPSNVPEHVTNIPVYRAQIISASYYDVRSPSASPNSSRHHQPSFTSLWRKGLPLLVKNVGERFKLPWDPQSFISKYGDQPCLIVECQTDSNRRVTIKEFFQWFGNYTDRNECWKLKDWPPTSEFKAVYPDLFDDFSNAVPAPDYVRRDGVFNIGSHFPANAVGPDLGPKMYNSMASSQEAGSKGSTRLHMDMADALNVMLHATPCQDGTPGYAVWDLYRAEDSDKLRMFLRKKFHSAAVAAASSSSSGSATANGQQNTVEKATLQQMAACDPIHSQQFYLDVELRRQLYEEFGVQSFRIYQRPGEGIFIPAGCAHQVANIADCVKIAIDFVSPENIDRCVQLTKEFREQNQRKAWKEDVLQLRTMMWFAWQSCCVREGELDDDDSALGGQTEPRVAQAPSAAAASASAPSNAAADGVGTNGANVAAATSNA